MRLLKILHELHSFQVMACFLIISKHCRES
jgi:hypothetical protein